ncbi:3-oxo-5-alpha-steroid 4-dehydrogenase 1 isoform X2 [Pongo pygmaeus]|uniref:3-oxo-5-alpha-steroid 4-dehydrogenase 1 isoform X2 n=1 Tax=Pongo pygmaeus TaxID=9600 RepID=UPI0023E109F7|nr:3-oxo-5-alpha-steroid 4-dehydrogenase 1 isoform X2 [Pongo pygmaeus]XP_054411368.1 3-oxo-5-alpha-steroid 4-dehydrogenase 1 isoform X2 [Pongo abelii]
MEHAAQPWRWQRRRGWRRSACWPRSPTCSAPRAARSSRGIVRRTRCTAATRCPATGSECRRGPPGWCRSCPRWPCRSTSTPASPPRASAARPTASSWPCSSSTTGIGFGLWLTGMLINIHSDHILRNLRKPGDTGYKIPRGGLFEYVTAANYFGEIMEWCGYALASWSVQGAAFAFFTFCFLSGRAKEHHEWYLRKFEEYPKFRKIIIPFLF